MPNGQIEATFLGQSTGVGDDRQSVHLQLVVIVEAQRLVDTDTRVEFKAALFQTVLAAGMAGVENGHIVLFCQSVDGGKQAHEILLENGGLELPDAREGEADITKLYLELLGQAGIPGMEIPLALDYRTK